MNNNNNALKMVLIGAGRFIEDTILPALIVQKQNYDVVHVVTKSGSLKESIRTKLINPSTSISNTLADLSSINFDCIFISIPQSAIKSMLKDMCQQDMKNKIILFSTPVAPINCFSYLRKLANHNKLYSFEFLPFHPIYQLSRALINKGELGELRKISLHQCGYLYHGLSTLRYLSSYRKITSSHYFAKGKSKCFKFTFDKNIEAEMLGPKDYNNGYFVIDGVKSSISNKQSKAKTFISVVLKNELISYYTINNEMQIPEQSLVEVSHYLQHTNQYPPVYKQEFLIAAVNYFDALSNCEFLKLHSIEETLYEHWLIRLTRKFTQTFSLTKTPLLYRIIKRLTS